MANAPETSPTPSAPMTKPGTAPQAPTVPGTRKAAILTLLLGEDSASQIFKFLHEEEVERIAREVASLGTVQPETGGEILQEFHTMWQAADYVNQGGVEFAQRLLLKTLGPDTSRRIIERVVKSVESTLAFNSLEK